MATLEIDIADSQIHRVRSAVEALGPNVLGDQRYVAAAGVQPGETITVQQAAAVARAMVRAFLRDIVVQHEAEQARQSAILSARASVENDGVVPD